MKITGAFVWQTSGLQKEKLQGPKDENLQGLSDEKSFDKLQELQK